MGLSPELSRLAKLLIDAEGITDAEAEMRLRAMTLEIVAGSATESVSAQSAILTAVAVGARTFVGGVRVVLNGDVALQSKLPLGTASLKEGVTLLGAADFAGPVSAKIAIGDVGDDVECDAYTWWSNWTAGSSAKPKASRGHDNPLVGIAAGAASVARAFAAIRQVEMPPTTAFDLWPTTDGGKPPAFEQLYLPSEFWILGLGNLGQAMLWSLASLPYPNPSDVKLVLQDRDCVSPENWGTSILVRLAEYGAYKTAVGEEWSRARGFDVRRVDRWLDSQQRVHDGEPRIAFCGFDSVGARRLIQHCGFDLVIDAGLGRSHTDFDRFRITIFDSEYTVGDHFSHIDPASVAALVDYEKLLDTDACGAAMFDGIAIAAPFASAIAGAAAVARAIAIASGVSVPRNEVRRLSNKESRASAHINLTATARSMVRVPAAVVRVTKRLA